MKLPPIKPITSFADLHKRAKTKDFYKSLVVELVDRKSYHYCSRSWESLHDNFIRALEALTNMYGDGQTCYYECMALNESLEEYHIKYVELQLRRQKPKQPPKYKKPKVKDEKIPAKSTWYHGLYDGNKRNNIWNYT